MDAEHELPQYHVLNFFHDDDDACALTALVHHVRYHIIVEPDRLADGSDNGKRLAEEYGALLRDVKKKEEEEAHEAHEQESQSRASDRHSRDTDDSGIDVPSTPSSPRSKSPPKATRDPRALLHDWILTPLASDFASQHTDDRPRRDRTVQRWYHTDTHFCHLALSPSSSLVAEPEDPSPSLSARIRRLLPSLTLPKYIRSLGIPLIPASELVIRAESSDPYPIHPALVRRKSSGEEFFLKVVDTSQPGPTKREIRIMKEIEKKGLHEKIRVPLVRGLVFFSGEEDGTGEEAEEEGTGARNGGKREIMGFLMDVIEDPTPLTYMLDSGVAQERREGWAEEAERMVGILHENGIIWGDAKGDNFMVDRHDRLWIIDFGGSYTPGWVDPELNETEAGDEQGVTRLVNGLIDPEEGTVGDEDDERARGEGEGQGDGEGRRKHAGEKRKASEVDPADEKESEPKQRKRNDARGDEMCVCGGPEAGKMIGCDGDSCEIEWFHMTCVRLKEVPEGKWYCDSCKAG